MSLATLNELADVLRREAFDRYVTLAEREELLEGMVDRALWVEPTEEVHVCRDPTDDKFLTLAVSAEASCIVSGDADLLVLHPFRGILILTPSAFLDLA